MKDTIVKLESNIDDSTGEMLGYVMELLFASGACDVYYMPIYMKKNRPAWQLNVLCKEKDIATLEEILFFNTTTIGIRRCEYERTICEREIYEVDTEYGAAKVKVCTYNGYTRVFPEYESIVSICKSTGRAYAEIYQMIVNVYNK